MSLFSNLVSWFHCSARVLPWRTPLRHFYPTWISEVMSQQTVLKVVVPRFETFIKELPDISALAYASEEKIRPLWAGLGYYARARLLQKGAKQILETTLPTSYLAWKEIPGCGDYTSAMLASLCWGERVPAIDGNVIRVMSRYLGLKTVWNKSDQEKIRQFLDHEIKLSPHSPGDFNESLIELGATICSKSSSPSCSLCPLSTNCKAFLSSTTHLIPPPKPRKEKQVTPLTALIYYEENKIHLIKRETGRFLRNTHGFPLFEDFKKEEGDEIITNALKHSITHHDIRVSLCLRIKKNENIENKQKALHALENSQTLSSSLDQKILKYLLSVLQRIEWVLEN